MIVPCSIAARVRSGNIPCVKWVCTRLTPQRCESPGSKLGARSTSVRTAFEFPRVHDGINHRADVPL